jgi:hypothetical protein
MVKRFGVWPILGLAILGLAALACSTASLTGGASDSLPTVTILSPASGSSVPLDTQVDVQVSASDPGGPGVTRIDLQVNGVTLDTFQAGGPQATVTTNLTFTPGEQKAITVEAVAFREDGMASDSAAIALTVTGAAESSSQDTNTDAGSSEDSRASAETYPTARVTIDSAVRTGPGPTCPLIKQAPTDTVINLLAFREDPRWWKTDWPDREGWIFAENVMPIDDTSEVPQEQKAGCQGCGDGTCGSDETCDTCPGDCGQCCGNGACEAGFGEDCNTCQADCGACAVCGDGKVDEGEDCDGGGCQAGYSCVSCACVEDAAPKPECGNGKVESGEECDGGGCGQDESCVVPGCFCIPDLPDPPQPECGNGNVEPGELCDGDASTCNPGQYCLACDCVTPFCGNGDVEPGEECDGSDATCGPAESCTAGCFCDG